VTTIKPIYLLADSQLLFWRDEEGALFLDRARALLEEDEPGKAFKAAYLGASNGDAPEFYELFVAAMGEIHISNCRMIRSQPDDEDLAFLKEADLVLLAGGDVRRGWDAFQKTGMQQKIVERYYGGAVLIGISAGAVQLGLKGWDEEGGKTFDTFRVVPFVVDVHDEPSWARLNRVVPKAGEHARGFGIPSGAGALYHPDYSVEPVRHPLVEVSLTEEGVRQALLFPGQTAEVEEAAEMPRPNYLDMMEGQGVLDVESRHVDEGEAGAGAGAESKPPGGEPVN
jgi:peptidase S51-like protein